jgi:hypothetical protein
MNLGFKDCLDFKKQVLYKNQYVAENKEGNVQSDCKVLRNCTAQQVHTSHW